VGHHDDLSLFSKYLTGEDIPTMKKGSVAVIALPEASTWADLKKGKCSFVYYLTPQFIRMEELDR
jgi:hypothetical protein